MTAHRIGKLLAVAAALALAGCNATKAPQAATLGAIQAQVAAPPAAVQAVLVVVEVGTGIPVALRAALQRDGLGTWSGQVVSVPAGVNRSVTVYAYDGTTIPANPVEDTAGLIYKGGRTGVMVKPGELTQVSVALLPWPDGGGSVVVNTPPHFTSLVHAATIPSDQPTTFRATAADPDIGATLSYRWAAGRGSFAGGDGAEAANVDPGQQVSVDYRPAPGFTGTDTVELAVSDGTATVYTTFPVTVGSGVDVGLVFVVLPELQLLGATFQDLAPGESSEISWQLAYPSGVGPGAPSVLEVGTAWTDTCGGTFEPAKGSQLVVEGNLPETQFVLYRAPPVADTTACELTLTASDPSGAATWTRLYVWVTPVVQPVDLFTGAWQVQVFEPAMGPTDVSLQLQQAGDQVTGTFSYPGNVLSLSGTVTGSILNFSAAPQNLLVRVGAVDGASRRGPATPSGQSGCNPTLTGTIDASGNSLQLSYTGMDQCVGYRAGSGSLAPIAANLTDKVVFVTSEGAPFDRWGGVNQIDGAYLAGDLARADDLCMARAAAGGFGPGSPPAATYKAFISNSTTAARDRIADGRYVLPNGVLVALSKADLLDGSLQHGIDMDETGAWGLALKVRTGTEFDGTSSPDNCNDWTSAAPNDNPSGLAGYSSGSSFDWTAQSTYWCTDRASLYCFQQ